MKLIFAMGVKWALLRLSAAEQDKLYAEALQWWDQQQLAR